MTRDRARKQSVRARMSASGEPYSVAARKLADEMDPGDATAISLLRERVDATLDAPSARIWYRTETDLGIRGELLGQLFRTGLDALMKRIARNIDIGTLGSGYMTGEGFAEPAAGRYQIRWGEMATVILDGRQYMGRRGEPVEEHPVPGRTFPELLEGIRHVTSARFSGADVVRGTPCRVIVGEKDAHEFTIWVDDAHIRRIHEEYVISSMLGKNRAKQTLELWDFGVSTAGLNWSRFPGPQ